MAPIGTALIRNGGIVTFPFFDDEVDVIRDLPTRIKRAQYWKGKIQGSGYAIGMSG